MEEEKKNLGRHYIARGTARQQTQKGKGRNGHARHHGFHQ